MENAESNGNAVHVSSFEEQLEKNGRLIWTNVGMSMMPLLREKRDIMIIDKRPEGRCRKLDAVLFRRDGVKGRGEYVLHRILRVNDDGTYWIVGDNCTSGEIVREDQILGVLSGVLRGNQQIAVTDKKYLRYVHLWCDVYPLRFAVLKCRNLARRVLGKIKRVLLRK